VAVLYPLEYPTLYLKPFRPIRSIHLNDTTIHAFFPFSKQPMGQMPIVPMSLHPFPLQFIWSGFIHSFCLHSIQAIDSSPPFFYSQLKEKRKKYKKEGKDQIEEDDPGKYKHACYVMTCKLFADLERLRKEGEMKSAESK
jgi:hypothetical protein